MAGEDDVSVQISECLAERQVVSSTKNLAATAGYAANERNCSS